MTEPKTLTPARLAEIFERITLGKAKIAEIYTVFEHIDALTAQLAEAQDELADWRTKSPAAELGTAFRTVCARNDALTAKLENAQLRWTDWQQVATDRTVEIHRLTAEVERLKEAAYGQWEKATALTAKVAALEAALQQTQAKLVLTDDIIRQVKQHFDGERLPTKGSTTVYADAQMVLAALREAPLSKEPT